MSLLRYSLPCFGGQVLSLDWNLAIRLGWLARESLRVPLVSAYPASWLEEHTAMLGFLKKWLLEIQLSFSCLCSKHFADWVFSPTHGIFSPFQDSLSVLLKLVLNFYTQVILLPPQLLCLQSVCHWTQGFCGALWCLHVKFSFFPFYSHYHG